MTPVGSCLRRTASRTSKNDQHPSHRLRKYTIQHAAYKHNPFSFFSAKVEKLEVILGRTFRKQNSSSEQIFKVEKYWIHEKFNNETFDNDIGE